jgi:uncharacterized protein (DUF2147 family)
MARYYREMNKFISLFFCTALSLIYLRTAADESEQKIVDTPVGLWRTIDDNDEKPRAIVEIYEKNEKLYGRIIKTFPRPKDKDLCEKCTGELKDAKILGLEILKGVYREDQNSKTWSGGTILDPANGKHYKVYIELQNDEGPVSRKLKVRGYIGFSLLGRTQYWYQQD